MCRQQSPERTFTYICIPADETTPVAELSATTRSYGDALAEHILPSAFAGGSVTNTHGLRSDHGSDVVDEKMAALNVAAAQGTVEVFALMRPSPTTLPVNHSGVYLYLDEMGVLKDLPVNARATNLARAAGIDVESPFHGDVFVGRVVVDPSPSRNASFAAAELESDSAWMRCVAGENHAYGLAMAEYEKAAKAKQVGAVTEADEEARGWRWAQTAEDVEVTVAVPDGTRARDVAVVITASSLSATLKASTENPEAATEFALYGKVRVDESAWTVGTDARGRHVQVTMEKLDAVTWPALEAAPSK